MQFRVGQRVRIVRPSSQMFGHEATILGVGNFNFVHTGRVGFGYEVCIDGFGAVYNFSPRAYPAEDLAPLTDPKADEFIAQVKSWGPLQPQTITSQLEESLLMVRGGSQ